MAVTWFDGTSTGYEAQGIGPLFTRETMGWYDPRYYGALLDLKRFPVGMSAGSPVVSGPGGPFLASNGDAGKRAHVIGAGSTLLTNTDGAMTFVSSGPDRNILTGTGFTSAIVGRQISVTGAGAAGATLKGKVWGVISSTQLRMTVNCATTVTGATYTISDDLYANVIASSASSVTLDANASNAVTLAYCFVATDDSAAINATIVAALADAPRATQGAAPTIYFPYSFGIGSTIEITSRVRLVGGGLPGFSSLLGYGTVVAHAVAPGLPAYIRRVSVAGGGLGLRGSITSGTAILTDPDGAFVAGDAGKRFNVIGAGVQTGSQTQVSLATTILSVDSAVQVTLAANASTTITDAVYSYAPLTAVGVNNSMSIERLHFMGSSGQKCGLHTIGANEYELSHCVFSDFVSGIGHFGDGMTGNTQNQNISNCSFNTCRTALKIHLGDAVVMSGKTMVDGGDNVVGVTPGPGTIGIDCDSMRAPDAVTIQSWDTGLRIDGGTAPRGVSFGAVSFEACVTGAKVAGNSSTAGNGTYLRCSSWSASGIGGIIRDGLALLAGATNTIFIPGYYLTSDIDMYGACDATALADCITIDPNSPMQAGGVSTTTPGAVTTVSIAHGLRATPTRFSAERGDANARGAPAYHVTVTSTNVVLNFASALTGATAYTWNWTAGI